MKDTEDKEYFYLKYSHIQRVLWKLNTFSDEEEI